MVIKTIAKVKNFRCFNTVYAGFDSICPINIITGVSTWLNRQECNMMKNKQLPLKNRIGAFLLQVLCKQRVSLVEVESSGYPGIIIGKNNTGKSCLLDFVKYLTTGNKADISLCAAFEFSKILNEAELKSFFLETTNGGILCGNHWNSHGRFFVGKTVK